MKDKTRNNARKQGHATGHKGRTALIACIVIVIAVAVSVGIYVKTNMLPSNDAQNAGTNTNSAIADNSGNTTTTNSADNEADNEQPSSSIPKEAATNTETTVTMTIPSNDNGNISVDVSGTTDDRAIDDKIAKIVGLLASCAGNDAAPDSAAGDAAGMVSAVYFQHDDIPTDPSNLIELYRTAAQASSVYPALSRRTITKIDIIGSNGSIDGIQYYQVRVSSKDTRTSNGTKGVVTMLNVGFTSDGQAAVAYENAL